MNDPHYDYREMNRARISSSMMSHRFLRCMSNNLPVQGPTFQYTLDSDNNVAYWSVFSYNVIKVNLDFMVITEIRLPLDSETESQNLTRLLLRELKISAVKQGKGTYATLFNTDDLEEEGFKLKLIPNTWIPLPSDYINKIHPNIGTHVQLSLF